MAVSRSTSRRPVAFLTALMVLFALVVPLIGVASANHTNPRTTGTGAGVERIDAGADDTAPANTCNEFAVRAFGDPGDNTPAEGESIVIRAFQSDSDQNADVRLQFCDPDSTGPATDLSGPSPSLASGQQTQGGGTPFADCDDNGANFNDNTAPGSCPAATPVAGAEAPADIRDTCQTDAEGFCRFGVFSNEAGTMTVEVFAEESATVGNQTREGNDPFDTAQKTWTAGAGGARNLTCQPATDRNPEGTRHEFQCTVTDANGAAVPGATVSFDVTSGPNSEEVDRQNCGGSAVGSAAPANQQTNASGQTATPAPEQSTGGQSTAAGANQNANACGYNDTTGGTSLPGTDTITAWVNLSQQPGGPVPTTGPDAGEPQTTIQKTWVGPGRILDCEPETASNQIGTAHLVTCTLTDASGNPAQGVEIDFTSIGPGVVRDDQGPFVTNNAGQVQVTVENNQFGSTGTQTITGEIDRTPGGPGDSTNATVTQRTTDARAECQQFANQPRAGQPAGVCSDDVQKTWTTRQGEVPPECNDNQDNDGDGRVDYPADPDCAALEDNSEAHTPTTREFATNLTIRYDDNDNAFKGAAGSSRKGCQVGRQVTLKKVRPGRDARVGRDTTNRQGNWLINKDVRRGRYYAVVSRKVFTAPNGDTIKCLRDRSVTIKI